MPIEPDGLGATRDEYFFLALGQRDDGDALRLGQLAERFEGRAQLGLAAVHENQVRQRREALVDVDVAFAG